MKACKNEVTFTIRQDVPAQDIHKMSDGFKSFVQDIQGKVIKKEYWGLRTIPHGMKKGKKGHFLFLAIESNKDVMNKLEQRLKENNDIMRYMFVNVKKNYIDNKPSLMMQTPSETDKSKVL